MDYIGRKIMKIAVIPGSFKPPHIGHYMMIEKYSKAVDKVYVMISAPGPTSKSLRTINNKPIDPQIALTLLDIYCQHLPNVWISISQAPSPVKGAYDFIETLKDCDVIVGGSNKDGKLDRRWSGIKKYMEEHNSSINIIDDITFDASPLPISASDFRKDLQYRRLEKFNSYIPTHVNGPIKEEVFQLLGELSSEQTEWH